MAYLAYHFNVIPHQPGSEILIALIADFGFDTFDYSDVGFIAYINEELSTNLNFTDLKFDDFIYSYQIEKIKTINWNAEWEQNFDPVLVDDLLFIRAPFHEKNLSFKHEIVIMPKMSLGTGHHQTTRLVCKEMFSVDFFNKRVLDIGCGTGILAILSKKLGANEVIGIDIDEWSVENSVENCSVNMFPEIQIKLGNVDLLKNEFHFDIILANINKNILKKDIQYYAEKLVPKGRIFLSGFFTTDINEIKDVANINNLNFILSTNENEWAMMVFEKV